MIDSARAKRTETQEFLILFLLFGPFVRPNGDLTLSLQEVKLQ